MADAVHDLGDTLSIGSAWLLNKLGTKSATEEHHLHIWSLDGEHHVRQFTSLVNLSRKLNT